MAGTITMALRTAQSGLLVNQAALDTVANNIANVNSPGYSRKIVNLEQRVVSGVGAGVQLADVTRAVDEGLVKSLRLQLAKVSTLDAKTNYYARLQDLFGTPSENQSLSHILAEFTTALETLAVSPNQTLEQSELVRQAQNITLKFQQMSQTIQDLRVQADGAIAEKVDRVNRLTAQIADLNDKIIRNQTVTADVTDLRDQRDQFLDELSKILDVRYFYRSDGDVIVFTSSGRTLVDNVASSLSHSAASSMTPSTTHAEGDIGALYLGTAISANDITNEIADGEFKGLIEMRDQILPDLQSQIDSLAANLRDSFNQIHNRGIPFPGLQSMNGTRHFLDTTDAANNTDTQTITLDPTNSVDDVTIALFDSTGNQSAVTTLNTIMQSATYGTGAQASRGPWSIAEVAATVEDWLQASGTAAATVSIDNEGEFNIELNSTSLYLAFRDEAASANGSTAADAEIGFDADGDGTVDETVSGFSNFFGLNDFFVDGMSRNMHESDVMAAGFTASATTLRFVDGTSTLPLSAGADVTLAITAGSTLTEIATSITNGVANVTASVIPDGAGFRLRIAHDNGSDLEVTATTGTLLTTIGMHRTDSSVSTALDVRADILNSPSKVSSGAIQWDAAIGASGEYQTSLGDDTTVQALAEQFDAAITFKTAGGIGEISTSFSQYGAAIVSRNASLADTNESQWVIDDTLTRSLQNKSDTFRGVNLDEEMSNLILFEQAYAAAARVVSVIQKMFDVLDRTVG